MERGRPPVIRRVRRLGPLPAGAGAVRCLECRAEARADGKGSPIAIRHLSTCSEFGR